MAGTFFGLQVGLSGLRAHLRALEVVGHNVANVGNPAYARQEAVLRAAPPWPAAEAGRTVWLGAGVRLADVRRVWDTFLGRQVWSRSADEARARTARDLLARVEGVYHEPSDDGLQSLLDRFWAAWHEVANQPESLVVRRSLVERARALADGFRAADRQLAALARDGMVGVEARVTEVNGLAARLAELNRQIARLEAGGGRANDLRDRRDELAGRLVQLTGATVEEASTGTGTAYTVWLGGVALVEGTRARMLEAVPQSGGGAELVWSDLGTRVQPPGGELAAFLEFVQRTVPEQRAHLAALAEALTRQVNGVHRQGFGLDGVDQRDFFLWQGSLEAWDLDPQVAADPRAVAASASGAPGDGVNALAIAHLKETPLQPGEVPPPLAPGDTVGGAYQALVVSVGIRLEELERQADAAGVLLEQARLRLQEVSGVSLDEEMARMVELQHAYAAAARVVSVVDEMIETLVRGTGVVGR